MGACFDTGCSSFVISDYVIVYTFCSGSSFLLSQNKAFPQNSLGIAYSKFMDVNLFSYCGIASIEIYDTKTSSSASAIFSTYNALSSSPIIDCPSCASVIGTYNYYIKITPTTGTESPYWMDIDFTGGSAF